MVDLAPEVRGVSFMDPFGEGRNQVMPSQDDPMEKILPSLFELAHSNGCTVPEAVLASRGNTKEGAITLARRFAYINWAFDTIAQSLPPTKRYQLLLRSYPRNADEPLGIHEEAHTPYNYDKYIAAMSHPVGFALARAVVTFIEKEETPTRRIMAMGMARIAATFVQTPEQFLVHTVELLSHLDPNIPRTEYLRHIFRRDRLEEENCFTALGAIANEMEITHTKLWEAYVDMPEAEKRALGIIDLV